MKTIVSFFRKIRQAYFKWRLEREIFRQIFPHLEREKDCDYPFNSDDEFWEKIEHGTLDAKLHLEMIERQAEQMPKAYGEAFRYIAYRDLNERMRMYLKLAQRRVPPKCRIPRFAT